MRLAPEGRPIVGTTWLLLGALVLIAAWLGTWYWALATAWFLVALWVPWFFRDPERPGARGEHLVIAPADGKVVSVREVDEPNFLGGRAQRISVFMNIFNVHVNRYPVGGVVRLREYRPGAFVNATLDKASDSNESMSLGIEASRGRVLVRQIAGLVARRIVTDAAIGAQVHQGERLGIIRFGSRVDTFLPPNVTVRVHEGSSARAGITVLAEWPA